jgi:hypothetical protein
MDNGTILWGLAIFTLIAVLGFAIWQRFKVQKAMKEQHHSAVTEGRPDLRRNEDAPGVKAQ